jgi:hypothetical protein
MKTFRGRFCALASGLVCAGVLGLGAMSAAQEPAAGKSADAAPAKKSNDPTRRVPPFFGQIGLTPEQKEEIYKIRAKNQQKIDDLQKQLAKAQAEMLKECETVLNDTQKKLLENRRELAAKAKKAAAKPAQLTPAASAEKSGG